MLLIKGLISVVSYSSVYSFLYKMSNVFWMSSYAFLRYVAVRLSAENFQLDYEICPASCSVYIFLEEPVGDEG